MRQLIAELQRRIRHKEPDRLYISDIWNEGAILFWSAVAKLAMAAGRRRAWMTATFRKSQRRAARTALAWEVFE